MAIHEAVFHDGKVIRALSLDAAGTLIEPAEPVAEVYARHAAAAGIPLDPARLKQAFRIHFAAAGEPDYAAHGPAGGDAAEREWWGMLVERVLTEAAGAPLPPGFSARCFGTLFSHYEDASAWNVFPEVPGLLSAARAAGLKLAVVSNFDCRLHRILAGHGLEFDLVVTSADAAARKPSPRIFGVMLDGLGLEAAEVLHVGDCPRADLEGAAAAGLHARLVSRPEESLADVIGDICAGNG